MSYDPLKWAASEAKRPPRRRSWTGWAMLAEISVVLLLAILFTFRPNSWIADLPDVLILMLLPASLVRSPFAPARWFGAGGLTAFDEFERAALFRSTTRAYLVLSLGVAALLAYFCLAAVSGWPLPSTGRAWFYWWFATVMISLTLPIAIAELTIPIPPLSDEEEGL